MLIALLPLKGNSERVSQKNIRPLNGKPLFFYVADNIRKTKLFDKLVINTDSANIKKMAMERYGGWVNINNRPRDLQGDMISMNRIIEYDVKSMGISHDYMQTHSTSPFLSPKTIASAVTEYRKQKKAGSLDSLFSVSEIHSRLYTKNLCPINHAPHVLARTQDLEVVYEENSAFYLFSGESFMTNDHRIGKFAKIFPMPRNSLECLDIDEIEDWVFAEKILKTDIRV
jgi:N-acylneuraminate cytidylyltransferase